MKRIKPRMRFSDLVTIEATIKAGPDLITDHGTFKGRSYPAWRCLCDCGNETIVLRDSLLYGNTKSCGCRRFARRGQVKDITGERFGRLVVQRLERLKLLSTGLNRSIWRCLCDCGTEACVDVSELRSGQTRSCGCLRRDTTAAKNFKHGAAQRGKQTREYRSWQDMIKRCTNPDSIGWKNYGARGITVCKRWLDSFENFLVNIGPCPPGYTIERKNVNGHYRPSNCVWLLRREQALNTRKSIKITIDGDTRAVSLWARIYKINPYTIYDRLDAGWDPVKAVTTRPHRPKLT